MTWKNLIDGCFGVEDKVFAKHFLDRQRAAELLKECLEQGVTVLVKNSYKPFLPLFYSLLLAL